MQNRKCQSLILFLAGFFFSAIAVASSDTLYQQLRTVNVVATKAEKEVLFTPRSVTVLTRTDLDRSPYITLGNLLEEQSGIFMIGGGQAPGSNQTLFLRGANSNQTALFIDGIRVQDVSTINGVADLSELPISDVDRVEILRGAQSTLYGSPASGGVIRIFTRHSKAAAGFHEHIRLSSGSYPSQGHDLSGGLGLDYVSPSGWYINTSTDYLLSRGFNATLDTGAHYQGFTPDADPWDKLNSAVTAGFRTDRTSVSLSYRRVASLTDIDQSAYRDDDNYRLDFKRNMLSADLHRKLNERLSLDFTVGLTGTRRLAVNDSSVVPSTGFSDRTNTREDYSGRQLSSDLTINYHQQSVQWTSGLSFLSESMNQSSQIYSALYDPFIYEAEQNLDSLDPHAYSLAVFAHADLDAGMLAEAMKGFHLLAGMRLNHQSIYGWNQSLEVSPYFQPTDHSMIYLSASTGFTNPSLYQQFAPEQYVPFDGQRETGLSRGNRDLRPEQTLSLEAGYKENVEDILNWSVCVFRSTTKNLIDYCYVWDGATPVSELGDDFMRDDYRGDRYLNVGTQHVFGLEFKANFKFSDRFNLLLESCQLGGSSALRADTSAGLRFQSFSTGSFLSDQEQHADLIRRPSTGRLMLEYRPVPAWSLRLQIRHIGKRGDVYYDSGQGPFGALNSKSMAAYTLTDFMATWNANKGLVASFKLENLFNVSYQEIYGFRTRGFGVRIGFTYSF